MMRPGPLYRLIEPPVPDPSPESPDLVPGDLVMLCPSNERTAIRDFGVDRVFPTKGMVYVRKVESNSNGGTTTLYCQPVPEYKLDLTEEGMFLQE